VDPDSDKRIVTEVEEQLLCNEQLWDAVRAAVQSNVGLYSIDPRGMLNRGVGTPCGRVTWPGARKRALPNGATHGRKMAACRKSARCVQLRLGLPL
jgi:hypothetical protein